MFRTNLKTLMIAIAVFALLLALVCPALFQVQEAARLTSCSMNIRQIALGMLTYESSNGRLPVGIKMDETGRPFRSWRTFLYPHTMEQAQSHYDPGLAWDATKNKRIIDGTPVTATDKGGGNPRSITLDPLPAVWRCPTCERRSKQMNYAVVVGEETAFPINQTVKLDEITDGLENTILVVETLSGSTVWTEPKDLQFETMAFSIDNFPNDGLSSYHSEGVNVGFADGAAFFITKAISPDELRALLTIAGGESVTRQELIDRGVIR